MPDRNQIIEKLHELTSNGKVSCTDARKLAEELKVHPSEIGKLCDELNIKIMGCELGCF